ncbi:MAG TPA: hypothetical protein VN231_06080 [Allosphingosinicella sp.]|nr:hypothetical protein [Allosphingosinicella sp.]
MAAFHWTAADFYRSTPHEFFSAYEALREMNKPPEDSGGGK